MRGVSQKAGEKAVERVHGEAPRQSSQADSPRGEVRAEALRLRMWRVGRESQGAVCDYRLLAAGTPAQGETAGTIEAATGNRENAGQIHRRGSGSETGANYQQWRGDLRDSVADESDVEGS